MLLLLISYHILSINSFNIVNINLVFVNINFIFIFVILNQPGLAYRPYFKKLGAIQVRNKSQNLPIMTTVIPKPAKMFLYGA